MASTFSLPADYWKTLEITRQDVETLHTHLFEIETPLTAHDLAPILIESRIKVGVGCGAQGTRIWREGIFAECSLCCRR